MVLFHYIPFLFNNCDFRVEPSKSQRSRNTYNSMDKGYMQAGTDIIRALTRRLD
jgi:hypothetical protein